LASSLLSRLIVPPGARRISSVVPLLRWGGSRPASTDLVEVSRFWSVAMPVSRVQDFLRTHPPARLSLPGSVTGDGPGGTMIWDWYGGGAVGIAVGSTLTVQRPGPGIYQAQVEFEVASAGSGAQLRADSIVLWYPNRSAAEYLPTARYHAVTVTATIVIPRLHTVTRTFTSAAVIARLASTLNQAHATPAGMVFHCPQEIASFELAFRTTPGARPGLIANDSGCVSVGVTVNGTPQPALMTSFAGAAAQLLGVP
jgi:hypothetical protein